MKPKPKPKKTKTNKPIDHSIVAANYHTAATNATTELHRDTFMQLYNKHYNLSLTQNLNNQNQNAAPNPPSTSTPATQQSHVPSNHSTDIENLPSEQISPSSTPAQSKTPKNKKTTETYKPKPSIHKTTLPKPRSRQPTSTSSTTSNKTTIQSTSSAPAQHKTSSEPNTIRPNKRSFQQYHGSDENENQSSQKHETLSIKQVNVNKPPSTTLTPIITTPLTSTSPTNPSTAATTTAPHLYRTSPQTTFWMSSGPRSRTPTPHPAPPPPR
jgi:hypothetical protein